MSVYLIILVLGGTYPTKYALPYPSYEACVSAAFVVASPTTITYCDYEDELQSTQDDLMLAESEEGRL